MPPVPVFAPGNALESAGVVDAQPDIALIFSTRRKAKVASPVVQPVAVDMVDLHIVWCTHNHPVHSILLGSIRIHAAANRVPRPRGRVPRCAPLIPADLQSICAVDQRYFPSSERHGMSTIAVVDWTAFTDRSPMQAAAALRVAAP